MRSSTASELRRYAVRNVEEARRIALFWIQNMGLENAISFGLPEIDDRYHIWRVPLISSNTTDKIGEVVIDARSSLVRDDKSTKQNTLEARLLRREEPKTTKKKITNGYCKVSPLRNMVALGDNEEILQDLPAESVDLVFTSHLISTPDQNIPTI